MFKFFRRQKAIPAEAHVAVDFDAIYANNSCLLKENEQLKIEIRNERSRCDTIAKERDKLRFLVREQTEADLLINALRGLGIIPKPENYDPFSEQRRLAAQQLAAASCNTGAILLSNLGAFGNIFS